MKVMFSINVHDHEGDVYEECILLHLADGLTILKLKDLKQFDSFIENLQGLRREMVEAGAK